MSFEQYSLVAIVATPAVLFLAFAALWLLGWKAREKPLVRGTQFGILIMALGLGGLFGKSLTLQFGDWFRVGDYEFPLVAQIDELSLAMSSLTLVLVALVASFSRRYLHRDAGFFRFYLCLQIFALGSMLVFFAGSFDLVIAGWELLGLSSVLLIGYFRERPSPAEAGLRVFATYRFCDVGLLAGVVALHLLARTATFEGLGAPGTIDHAWIPAALLLFAAMGKSAQVPFSGWLPLAMEGPTPSSAIFYGAISVHMGAFLLLRTMPLLEQAPYVGWAAIAIGGATALHGTLVGRASADAKSAIAYACLSQLGLIFIEIGLGFPRLALLHIIGHSIVRMYEFLRAPSLLHEHHHMHAAAGGQLAKTGEMYEKYLPPTVRLWLYRWAVDRAHMEHAVSRFGLQPLYFLASFFHHVEAGWIGGGNRPAKPTVVNPEAVRSTRG